MSPPPPTAVPLPPLLIAVVGPSGSGKTTLITALLPALEGRGLRAGAIKHTSHAHPLQPSGSDTAAMLAAGARGVAFVTPAGVVSVRPGLAPSAASVADSLPACDVVLVEGWRGSGLPSLQIARAAHSDPAWLPPRGVVAWVGDLQPPPGLLAIPFEVNAVADYLTALRAQGLRAGA